MVLRSLLLLALSVVPPPATAADSRVVEAPFGMVYLSPDGDHVRDTAPIRFSLTERSSVRLTVHGPRLIETTANLGVLDAGEHVWRWDGLRSDGRPVANDNYVAEIRARDADVESTAYVLMEVRVHPQDTVVTTRRTVYPAATVVHDRIAIAYVREGWDPIADELGSSDGESSPMPIRVALRIRDADGDTVYRAAGSAYTARFSWDARGVGGSPLPVGDYHARLRAVDVVGNVETVFRRIRVSGEQLREETWTSTTPAGEAHFFNDRWRYRDPTWPLPAASQRFPGGLHFGYGAYSSPVPYVVGAADAYRITVRGGPTTPESHATGQLFGWARLVGNRPTVMGPGDATASGEWQAVKPLRFPALQDRSRPVVWAFANFDDLLGYDLATVTVEYRHYVPAS